MPDSTVSPDFQSLWRLGYHRLVPIVPPKAKVSEESAMYKRLAKGKADPRGKAPGVKNSDGE